MPDRSAIPRHSILCQYNGQRPLQACFGFAGSKPCRFSFTGHPDLQRYFRLLLSGLFKPRHHHTWFYSDSLSYNRRYPSKYDPEGTPSPPRYRTFCDGDRCHDRLCEILFHEKSRVFRLYTSGHMAVHNAYRYISLPQAGRSGQAETAGKHDLYKRDNGSVRQGDRYEGQLHQRPFDPCGQVYFHAYKGTGI